MMNIDCSTYQQTFLWCTHSSTMQSTNVLYVWQQDAAVNQTAWQCISRGSFRFYVSVLPDSMSDLKPPSVCPSCLSCATASCSSPSCCTARTSRASSPQSRDATASAATPQEPFPLSTRQEPTITYPHTARDRDRFISRLQMTKEELENKQHIKITLPDVSSQTEVFWNGFIADKNNKRRNCTYSSQRALDFFCSQVGSKCSTQINMFHLFSGLKCA